jgi:hypothetical protein
MILKMRQKIDSKLTTIASEIPLLLVGFLLADEARLERFVALSGITSQDLAVRMGETDFQAFVVDYVLEDQSLVLAFTTAHDLRPESLLQARRHLPGAEE